LVEVMLGPVAAANFDEKTYEAREATRGLEFN
jgi:hypothetical protein